MACQFSFICFINLLRHRLYTRCFLQTSHYLSVTHFSLFLSICPSLESYMYMHACLNIYIYFGDLMSLLFILTSIDNYKIIKISAKGAHFRELRTTEPCWWQPSIGRNILSVLDQSNVVDIQYCWKNNQLVPKLTQTARFLNLRLSWHPKDARNV